MANWEIDEDKKLIRYYFNSVKNWNNVNKLDAFINKKFSNSSHSFTSIKDRLLNIQYLHKGIGLSHFSNQTYILFTNYVKKHFKGDEKNTILNECRLKKIARGKRTFAFSNFDNERFTICPILDASNNESDNFPILSYFIESFVLLDKISLDKNGTILSVYTNLISDMWKKYDLETKIFTKSRNFVKTSSKMLMKYFKGNKKGNIILDGFKNFLLKKYKNFPLVCNYFEERQQNDYISGCIALALPIDGKNDLKPLFSINGSCDDYCGKRISSWSYTEYKKCIYEYVKQNLKILSKKDYLECHLTDAAFRYIKFPLYNKTFDGQLEQKPISIKKDFKLNGSDPLFLRHYSCSEKKIVAFLIGKNSDFNRLRGSNMPKNELSNYDLRVTRKPCVACMPALVGFNKIIFNYNNISSLLSGTEEYTLKSQKDLHMPYFFKKI